MSIIKASADIRLVAIEKKKVLQLHELGEHQRVVRIAAQGVLQLNRTKIAEELERLQEVQYLEHKRRDGANFLDPARDKASYLIFHSVVVIQLFKEPSNDLRKEWHAYIDKMDDRWKEALRKCLRTSLMVGCIVTMCMSVASSPGTTEIQGTPCHCKPQHFANIYTNPPHDLRT